MADPVLELRNVSASVGDVTILHNVSIKVQSGETHVLLGPNGSGKSTVLSAIMGLPPFQVTSGEILFNGKALLPLATSERAQLGIGLAFQRPPSLPGVTVADFASAIGAEDQFEQSAEALDLKSFVDRDLVVGFSGGEIKRWEVLKLVLQSPQLLLFDEPESGVDLAHVAAIGSAIDKLTSSPSDDDGQPRAALLITHTGLILDHVEADVGHIMVDGKIIHSGEPKALFRHIQTAGYRAPAA